MKKCKHCGAVQSDDNMICMDCSSPLGSSMSESENKAAESAIKEKVDAMAEHADEFYVSLRDKMMGYACIFFSVVALVLILLASHQYNKLEPDRITQMGEFILPDEVVITLPTKRMNQLSDAMGCGWISILFAILSSLALLLPRMMWLFETWKYRAHYGWDTPALPHVMMARKISAYIAWAISVVSLIYGWILFF